MSERMKQLLLAWAQHIRSDDAVTDEFITEGMSFQEGLDMMDEIAKAVENHVRNS